METTVSVNAVADYFIKRAHESGDPITNLKLQKLVYYAEAWHLAIHGKPLTGEAFQAWIHGPVSRLLYARFKDNKWAPIVDEVTEPDLPGAVVDVLKDVWEVYGGLSALDLERMTHSEQPWIEARGGCPPDERCETVISPRTMGVFYSSKLKANEGP